VARFIRDRYLTTVVIWFLLMLGLIWLTYELLGNRSSGPLGTSYGFFCGLGSFCGEFYSSPSLSGLADYRLSTLWISRVAEVGLEREWGALIQKKSRVPKVAALDGKGFFYSLSGRMEMLRPSSL